MWCILWQVSGQLLFLCLTITMPSLHHFAETICTSAAFFVSTNIFILLCIFILASCLLEKIKAFRPSETHFLPFCLPYYPHLSSSSLRVSPSSSWLGVISLCHLNSFYIFIQVVHTYSLEKSGKASSLDSNDIF